MWRGRASRELAGGAVAEAVFDAFELSGSGAWERTTSHHRQHHHPERVVRAALAAAGLECVGVYGHGFDARPEPGIDEDRHTKAVYIARHATEEGGESCGSRSSTGRSPRQRQPRRGGEQEAGSPRGRDAHAAGTAVAGEPSA
jgi:hypothetical protein